jgi:hypothetical protein
MEKETFAMVLRARPQKLRGPCIVPGADVVRGIVSLVVG